MCGYRIVPYSHDMDHPYYAHNGFEIFPEIGVDSSVEVDGVRLGDMRVGDVLEVIPSRPYPRHRWRKTGDCDGRTYLSAIEGVLHQHCMLGEPTRGPLWAFEMMDARGFPADDACGVHPGRDWSRKLA